MEAGKYISRELRARPLRSSIYQDASIGAALAQQSAKQGLDRFHHQMMLVSAGFLAKFRRAVSDNIWLYWREARVENWAKRLAHQYHLMMKSV